MSTEQILLIIILLVVPLIQHLLRAARQRDGPKREQAEGQPSSARRPPVRERQPRRAAARRTSPDAVIAPPQWADAPVDSTARRRARRGTVIAGLGTPFDLRRTIVLMTVIGPCRATDPYDWPHPGGRR